MSARLLGVALCVVLAGAFVRLTAASDVLPEATLASLPLAIDGWRGRDDPPLDPEIERTLQADSYILRSYARGRAQVGLYAAYYASQRSGHTIHSPLNCLPGTGWEWLERGQQTLTVADGQAVEVNRALAQKDADRLLLYYWYQSRGRVVAGDLRNKLLLVRDALTLHRSDGALIRVVAPVVDGRPTGDAAQFIRALYPAIVRHLPE